MFLNYIPFPHTENLAVITNVNPILFETQKEINQFLN